MRSSPARKHATPPAEPPRRRALLLFGAVGLLFVARANPRYPAWVIRGGSCAAMLVGALWFVERTADVSLLPL